MAYKRIQLDIDEYERCVRSDSSRGRCFVCEIVAGVREDQAVIFRDDLCIAFLAKWPTLLGYTLVAPLEHRTDVVGGFTEDEYAEFQRRIHRIGRAISASVPTERLYVLTLGSHQGNAHVHWHLAALPPAVAYREQQYASLMHENGYLDVPEADQAALARQIYGHLREPD